MTSRMHNRADDTYDWEVNAAMGKRDCTGVTCQGGCGCFEGGYDEGKDNAVWEASDEHDRELIEALWREAQKEINRTVRPLEDQVVLHGDHTNAKTVALLKDLISRLRPLFD
jgi:hypothetical protein